MHYTIAQVNIIQHQLFGISYLYEPQINPQSVTDITYVSTFNTLEHQRYKIHRQIPVPFCKVAILFYSSDTLNTSPMEVTMAEKLPPLPNETLHPYLI